MIHKTYPNDLQVLRETVSDFIDHNLVLKPQNIDMAIRHFSLSDTSITTICETSTVPIESVIGDSNFEEPLVSVYSFHQLDAYQLREAFTELVNQGYPLSFEFDYVSISAWLVMCDRILRLEDL